jgi:uncharacterized tellurite resistance protein B-like protein
MDFTKREKLAIVRILEKVAKADDKLVEEEMQILLNAARYLDIHEEEIRESKDMTLHEAGELLRDLDPEKMEFVNATLIHLMTSDGSIDISEVQTLLEAFFGTDEEAV